MRKKLVPIIIMMCMICICACGKSTATDSVAVNDSSQPVSNNDDIVETDESSDPSKEKKEEYTTVSSESVVSEPETNEESSDMGGEEDVEPTDDSNAPGETITLDYFIGEYHGINPYFVVDWDTYEMSEDVDHSACNVVKTEDSYELTNIILDSTKPLNRHEELETVVLHDSDMTYVLDDGQEDLWDSLEVDTVYDKIIFARRQKDGQLMIAIDLGGAPQVFIPNK